MEYHELKYLIMLHYTAINNLKRLNDIPEDSHFNLITNSLMKGINRSLDVIVKDYNPHIERDIRTNLGALRQYLSMIVEHKEFRDKETSERKSESGVCFPEIMELIERDGLQEIAIERYGSVSLFYIHLSSKRFRGNSPKQ